MFPVVGISFPSQHYLPYWWVSFRRGVEENNFAMNLEICTRMFISSQSLNLGGRRGTTDDKNVKKVKKKNLPFHIIPKEVLLRKRHISNLIVG